MAKTLYALVRSSGNSGASGQSFRNHVTGAASGAKMTDYLTFTLEVSGGVPAPEVTYDDQHTFQMDLLIVENSRAHHIRRAGNVMETTDPFLDYGFSAAVTASNVTGSNGAPSSYVNVQVRAPYRTDGLGGGSAWFTGYTYPNEPSHSNPASVAFSANYSYSGGAPTVTTQFRLRYVPDLPGQFNVPIFAPPLNNSPYQFSMVRRSESASSYEWEWHNNSSYTSLHAAFQSFTVTSNPQDSFTYYLRFRRIGAGSWTNHGAVTFVDPRESV